MPVCVISMTEPQSVIAIMLGRLKMSIPECMAEYRRLSTEIISDRPPPVCSRSKLLVAAKDMVSRKEKERTHSDQEDLVFLQPRSQLEELPQT